MNDLLPLLQRGLPDAVQFLGQMVTLESPSDDKQLVDKFGCFVAERFAAIGGRVNVVSTESFGDHLLVHFQGISCETVLLLGHLDTVFPAGEIHKRPFKIEARRAFGPGVFDMKSGILLMWMALKALQDRHGAPPRNVTVLLNSDEEIGSNSSRTLIEQAARNSKAVLVLEPSLPGGTLKTARKGVGRFIVKAIGRAAHAGIDPAKGVNAIEEIARQILRLQQMTDVARGTTITVGVVHGGTRSNVVPAEATVDIDVRIASSGEAERITAEFHALTPILPGAQLQVRGSINRPPMERTPGTARLFEIARQVAAQMKMELQEGSTGGASDGNLTSALGTPTLDGLGAIGGGAHAVHEFIELDSLPERAALIAGLIQQV
jgi:glutamate carboxypeptidase